MRAGKRSDARRATSAPGGIARVFMDLQVEKRRVLRRGSIAFRELNSNDPIHQRGCGDTVDDFNPIKAREDAMGLFCFVFSLAGSNLTASLRPRLVCVSCQFQPSNHTDPQMKIAFIAAAAALLAASCCPNAAPAPSKPAYVAPSK